MKWRKEQALPLLRQQASTFFMSWMKPMSSMRSASSSTRISTWLRSNVRWPSVVEQAAGRGDEDVGRRAQAVDCGCMPTPPNITMVVRPLWLAVGAHAFLHLAASSRGGREDERADGRAAARATAPAAIRRCSIGSVNAAVLPVPVCARPSGRRRRAHGNGLGLDRGRGLVALFAHGAQDRRQGRVR